MKILSTITHHNFNMMEARRKAGITQSELARGLNVRVDLISKIELLRNVGRIPGIDLILIDIADYLRVPFDQLFPSEYLKALYRDSLPPPQRFLLESQRVFDRGKWEVHELLPPTTDIDRDVIRQELSASLYKYLEDLPVAEKRAITLHFGLDDGQERTLEEISEIFHLSRERVRQLIAVGLARLRNPRILNRLRELRE
jgi:RNA polymerase sigma factor (sigma-70 family)